MKTTRKRNTKGFSGIVKIDKERYMVQSTGEIKEYSHSEKSKEMITDNRRESMNKKFSYLRQHINMNFRGDDCERHITITYAEPTEDMAKCKNDFKKYNDIGLYFRTLLGEECSADKKKKSSRLEYYPQYTKIYTSSKGLEKPSLLHVNSEELKEIIGNRKPCFEQGYSIRMCDTDHEVNRIGHITYNDKINPYNE